MILGLVSSTIRITCAIKARLDSLPVGHGGGGGGKAGLGLAISKRIVELHGGTMTVASEIGKGSSFLFTLSMAGTQS